MSPTNGRILAAATMLLAAILFAIVGFRSEPRNTTYIALGAVFAVLAAVRFRRAKTP